MMFADGPRSKRPKSQERSRPYLPTLHIPIVGVRRIANRLATKDDIKLHTIFLNVLSEILNVVSTLVCMLAELSKITSAALLATFVPELTDAPMSACARARMSFVPSPLNITFAVCLNRQVEADCRPSWIVRTKSALDLSVRPPMA